MMMSRLAACRRSGLEGARGHIPGLLLVTIIAASAYGLQKIELFSWLSPMILAIVMGAAFHHMLGVPGAAAPGMELAGKRVLRVAVALLGLQITFAQIAAIGPMGLARVVLVIAATFLFTLALGRVLGVESRLSVLIGGGTTVCGASAIVAINSVAQADDDDVSYAVACITLFGTIAMVLLPVVLWATGMDAERYGQWVGLSVHEVAQVVAAGFQGGTHAGETAVVTKLARVVMLAPLVVSLALFAARSARLGRSTGHSEGKRPQPVPLFVLGFVALAAANSMAIVPEIVRQVLVGATPVLLTFSLAALGLGTSFARIKARGARPMALAALSSAFIVGLGFLSLGLSA